MFRRALLATTLAAPLLPRGALAQSFPDRPVRFIVAFAPGGPADIVARLLGQALSEVWPHPVVVENRGGAGGNIAAQAVARMRPDGLAMLLTTSAFAVNPSLSRRAGYEPADFVAAAIVAATPNLFVVRPQSEVRTLRDLVELGRRRGVNFGSAGIGSTPHLSAENLLKRIARVDAQHIPFTGAGPALAAVLGGQIDMASVALPAAVEAVRSGAARGLAVTSATRVARIPDVPTVAEAGFEPIVDLTWVGVFLPAGVPPALLAQVNADIGRVLATPAFRDRLAATGFDPMGGSPEEAQRFVDAELLRWGDVVRALDVSVD
jgi:tripartite-type tricarboxylate transporter receptor subunit TctC